MDDELLVAAIRSGEADGYRLLVARETGRLYRLAFRILANRPDAEDVVQETFIVAARSFATYRGEGPLRAWLARIAARIAYRHAGARPDTGDIAAIDEPVGRGAGVDPLATTLDRESQLSIRAAVESLPDPYREVVVLRYFAELSIEETAAIVGRPVNTTKSQVRRGLQRLRSRLRAEAAA